MKQTKPKFYQHLVWQLLLLFLGIVSVQAQQVTGTVTGSGEPLIGCSVAEKGTTNGVFTDLDGKFSLEVSNSNAILVFSFIGFDTKELALAGQSEVNVELASSALNLNEVIVVAYGAQRKSDVTGAIGSLKTKDFNKGVIANAGQLLQGKIAGVNVTASSGEPGAAQNVIIRGVGSLRSGTTPLYVIDGFTLDNTSTGVATNPLNFINPDDIESIEVLKDASAAALYGARAANGVVVITTKKGREGKNEMNLSLSTALSRISNKIDVFSADEFRQQVRAIGGNLYDAGGNTNWQDELTQTGVSNRINLSLSGAATDKFSYFISAGLDDQEGILLNSKLKRYSGRVNINQTAMNGRLKVDYNLTGAYTDNIRPDAGSTVVNMLQLNPTIPARTNGEPTLLDEMLNPLILYDLYRDQAYNNRLLANIAPSFKIIEGLVYKLNLGIDFANTERDIQTIPYNLLTNFEMGNYQNIVTKNSNNLVENTLTYNFSKNVHNFNLLAGHTYQKTFERQNAFNLRGFVNNGIEPIYQDQTSTQEQPTTLSSYGVRNELQSFFGRINYAYQNKYMATVTMRADGSSKFGGNNKYGYFPSLAAGWNIANEAFMSGSLFNVLKLRTSWGQTGNQEIPSKITLASYTESNSNNDTYPLDPGATTLDDYPYGTIFTRLANPDIRWEVSTQTDIGLDFGLLDHKLTGTIDYFNKISENILLEVVTADPIQPTNTYWTNINDMQIRNSGIELSLDYKTNTRKNFYFNVGGNVTFNNNEVVNSPYSVLTSGAAQGAGQTGATINGYINGHPIGAFYMKEFAGIGEDGLNAYVDYNKDGEVLENDRYVVGSALPNLLYAFYGNLSYKNFDFGMNFNGVSGNKIYNHTRMSIFNKGSLSSSFNTNSFAVEYPEESITNSNEVSTRYLEDGSYLRLNNASLAYNLKLKGEWFNNIRISVTGQNLFVLTKYSGFDPEINTGTSIGGIQTFGIDRFTYPSARTVMFGLEASF